MKEYCPDCGRTNRDLEQIKRYVKRLTKEITIWVAILAAVVITGMLLYDAVSSNEYSLYKMERKGHITKMDIVKVSDNILIGDYTTIITYMRSKDGYWYEDGPDIQVPYCRPVEVSGHILEKMYNIELIKLEFNND